MAQFTVFGFPCVRTRRFLHGTLFSLSICTISLQIANQTTTLCALASDCTRSRTPSATSRTRSLISRPASVLKNLIRCGGSRHHGDQDDERITPLLAVQRAQAVQEAQAAAEAAVRTRSGCFGRAHQILISFRFERPQAQGEAGNTKYNYHEIMI